MFLGITRELILLINASLPFRRNLWRRAGCVAAGATSSMALRSVFRSRTRPLEVCQETTALFLVSVLVVMS